MTLPYLINGILLIEKMLHEISWPFLDCKQQGMQSIGIYSMYNCCEMPIKQTKPC